MIIAQSNGMCLGNALNGKTWPTYCTEKWVPTAEMKSWFMTWMILLDALLWDAPTSTPVNISLLTLEWRLGLFLKEFSLEPMFLSNDHKISPELILCAVNKCNVTKVCDCRSSQKNCRQTLKSPLFNKQGDKSGEIRWICPGQVNRRGHTSRKVSQPGGSMPKPLTPAHISVYL